MFKFKGFKASLNLASLTKNNLSDKEPEISWSGAYRGSYVSYDESFEINKVVQAVPSNRNIRPSMVKLPPSRHVNTQSNQTIEGTSGVKDKQTKELGSSHKLEESSDIAYTPKDEVNKTTQKLKTQELNTPQETTSNVPANSKIFKQKRPKSETKINSQPEATNTNEGTEIVKNTKQQEKELKKLEKEQKKLQKIEAKERIKKEKMRRDMEKKEAIQKAREERAQREKERRQKKATASKPQVPVAAIRKNPLARTPASNAQGSTDTLKSSISTNSGPPPYRQVAEMSHNKEKSPLKSNQEDITGNTSFGKPIDTDSWDLIAQHRQQMSRPVNVKAHKTNQVIMDLNFGFSENRVKEDQKQDIKDTFA